MPAEHSSWSASGFERVMLCPGSRALATPIIEAQKAKGERRSSIYAAEGTAAHQVLTWALQQKLDAAAFIGRKISADGFDFEVDEDMAGAVQECIDHVRAIEPELLLVDRKVNYSGSLGLPADDAWGTLDVAAIRDTQLVVLDYKHGMGVQVTAGTADEPNPQLALYGLGALAEFEALADIETVRLVISQPRAGGTSWVDLTVDELRGWAAVAGRDVVERAQKAAECTSEEELLDFLSPGDKQCKFCAAAAVCPALRDDVAETIGIGAASPEDFADSKVPGDEHLQPAAADWLAAALGKVDLIEDWCKAVRAEVERRLLAGEGVPGYKVVAGKRGHRKWVDEDQALKLLRETFRLPIEKAFDLKLISPTSAEKLFKAGDIGPRQWPKAQALIVQPDGKPHVAPESDTRPALIVGPVADDFPVVASDLA